ncbi:MAG: L-serine ammonia-lyase, iron-sulfur-dependent, subunit alpha [Desulfosarcinaceae bacterium]|nr:L-serine ammonia-lyase, iron-sulfur-dependent, subunit alpha [Desulfosarcinaceae bacterium]
MQFTVKDILRMEVAPALGCTEPVAIALCAAAAAALVPAETITRIQVWVDANVYKNGVAVTIPGTGGLSGLETAAALGAVAGDAERKLEVLAPVTDGDVIHAQKLIQQGRVTVELLPEQQGLYVRSMVETADHQAEAIIAQLHDNLTHLALDGVPQPLPADDPASREESGVALGDLEAWLKQRSLTDLVSLLDEIDAADMAFLQEGIDVNLRLAEYGLSHDSGMGVGKTLERLVRQRLVKKDVITAARILTSAAADARMGGARLPAMSSAGSGNHGLTAILPIVAMEPFLAVDHDQVLKAVALSHIITGFVKAYTGRLSAICGCSVAAGAGAAAGAAYLLGGGLKHIAGAIHNISEDLAGIICDGAKAGCALKLATAAGTAVQAALFALQGVTVDATDGIIATTAEKTLKNVGTLTTEGMIETDRTILKIMLAKRFSDI